MHTPFPVVITILSSFYCIKIGCEASSKQAPVSNEAKKLKTGVCLTLCVLMDSSFWLEIMVHCTIY